MTCGKQFWKKMYTGWVMSIERQGNQGSTIPDTMCVVPYIAFYVSVCYFTKTRSNLLWFWWLQNLAVHTNTYTLHDELFLILSHLFFHNAIALPVLKFIFKWLMHCNINWTWSRDSLQAQTLVSHKRESALYDYHRPCT